MTYIFTFIGGCLAGVIIMSLMQINRPLSDREDYRNSSYKVCDKKEDTAC